MSDKSAELYKAFQKLMAIKGECKDKVCDLHGVAEMTVKQINYLKIIDNCDNITFSMLAEKTKITKPSVSDLINKLKDYGCAYKEHCTEDKRVSFIRLTEKGINIAQHEETATKNLMKRMVDSLNEKEIKNLIQLINKVE
jgi:DNA-binding MarR family transcriptional regulator